MLKHTTTSLHARTCGEGQLWNNVYYTIVRIVISWMYTSNKTKHHNYYTLNSIIINVGVPVQGWSSCRNSLSCEQWVACGERESEYASIKRGRKWKNEQKQYPAGTCTLNTFLARRYSMYLVFILEEDFAGSSQGTTNILGVKIAWDHKNY